MTLQEKYNGKNTLPYLDFSKIWKNIYLSYGPPHTTHALYRL